MQKKIPQRQCVACRGHFDKNSLLRLVKTQSGDLVFDSTGRVNGRGAYVCNNKDCFKKAIKINAFQRAFECTIDSNVLSNLAEQIKEDENG